MLAEEYLPLGVHRVFGCCDGVKEPLALNHFIQLHCWVNACNNFKFSWLVHKNCPGILHHLLKSRPEPRGKQYSICHPINSCRSAPLLHPRIFRILLLRTRHAASVLVLFPMLLLVSGRAVHLPTALWQPWASRTPPKLRRYICIEEP